MDGEEGNRREQSSVSQMLAQTRKERGLSLEEIEQAIKIHARHLEALEEEDFDRLPSPAWARGFLIMYATHLGFDQKVLGLDAETVISPRPIAHRSFRLKRFLKRRRTWIGALSIVTMIVALTTAVIIAPQTTFLNPITDFLAKIAPGLFLPSEPQRIAILGYEEGGTLRTENVLISKVSDDDLGLLAIPRNTWAEIPGGYGTGSIGQAFMLGGPDLTRRTAARLTGTDVQHYLTVDAGGIEDIVEAMGGVRVNVPESRNDSSPMNGLGLTLKTGPQMLNGKQALAYYLGEDEWSDVERAEHQLDFLYAMYRQAFGPLNLLSNPSTLSTVVENTGTDLSVIQVVQLTSRLRTLKNSGVSIDGGTVPGRETLVGDEREGRRATRWVPDTRKLPTVLQETVR